MTTDREKRRASYKKRWCSAFPERAAAREEKLRLQKMTDELVAAYHAERARKEMIREAKQRALIAEYHEAKRNVIQRRRMKSIRTYDEATHFASTINNLNQLVEKLAETNT